MTVVIVALSAAVAGGVLCWVFVGCAAKPGPTVSSCSCITRGLLASAGSGTAGAIGLSAVGGSHPLGPDVPALVCWSAALLTAAAFDAATGRVPTALVRQAGLLTVLLLLASAYTRGAGRPAAVAIGASAGAGAIGLVVRRVSHLGLGDVRLAALGGLGLGHATLIGAALGAVALAVVGAATAVHCRRSVTFPLGPALAAGFIVAAIA